MGGTYKAPDMAAANREAVMASIETFPIQRQIEAASRIGTTVDVPIYEKGVDTGRTRPVDFSKTSDIALTKAIGQALADLAPIQAERQLAASEISSGIKCSASGDLSIILFLVSVPDILPNWYVFENFRLLKLAACPLVQILAKAAALR